MVSAEVKQHGCARERLSQLRVRGGLRLWRSGDIEGGGGHYLPSRRKRYKTKKQNKEANEQSNIQRI